MARSLDVFVLVVTVSSGRVRAMSVVGHHQADATATGAAEVKRSIATGEVAQPGVWFAEQVIHPAQFLERLGALGWRATREQGPDLQSPTRSREREYVPVRVA